VTSASSASDEGLEDGFFCLSLERPLPALSNRRPRPPLQNRNAGPSKAEAPGTEAAPSAGMKRQFDIDERRVELDLESQVLALEVIDDRETASGEWSGHERAREVEPEIAPTLAEARARWDRREDPGFVSCAMLAQKAKVFDDGLYAAVDMVAQTGAGSFPGKASWLPQLLKLMSLARPGGDSNVASVLFAAARLGGMSPRVPLSLVDLVEEEVAAFLGEEVRSKPIGFYTWNDKLEKIFRQDRMLQAPLEGNRALGQLVHALESRPLLVEGYERYLGLIEQLTNPLSGDVRDLRDFLLAGGPLPRDLSSVAFFPPSRSHEPDLFESLFGGESPPAGFSLIDELIRLVREGKLSLDPSERSGWYDYQTWSLKPLLVPEEMPESAKIRWGEKYKEELEALFRGIIALTRETHIKQLEIPTCLMACPNWEERPIRIDPELSVEPLFSHYLRRAISYLFIRSVLEEHLGNRALHGMRRLTPDGPVERSLESEMREVAGLFYGASVTAARELGLTDEERENEEARWLRVEPNDDVRAELGSGRGPDADAELFRAWAQSGSDPDLERDVRMMVPVFHDLQREATKAWVFLGWCCRPMSVSFASQPEVRVLTAAGEDVTDRSRVEFGSRSYPLAYPVTAEVYVRRLLSRNELRALCDEHRTRTGILEALQPVSCVPV